MSAPAPESSTNTTAPPPSPPSTSSPPPATPSAPAPSSPSPPPPTTPAPASSPPPPPSSLSPSSFPPPPPPSSTASPPSSSSSPPPPPPSSSSASPPPPGSSSAKSSPPPPSSSAKRPPPPPTSSSSSSGLSSGVVVGIAIAGLAVLVVFTLCCIFCCRKKRRRDGYGAQSYCVPPPPPASAVPGPKDEYYGHPAEHWQQNYPPPPEHVMQKPSYPPAAPPGQQQAYISSGGGSGSNYSVPENAFAPPSPGLALGFSSKSTFTYEELAMATDGFSDANVIGQGGFGYVHKGVLPNGKEVAVKSLKAGSGQGEREFQAEVEIISRVHHRHLVSLVGYCTTGSQRMLVYEFVPNNTLEFHLHEKGQPTMDWPTRLQIALGAAKGLSYLHEDCHPKIIHRDIKASNILLDLKFEAKVADFGLAKLSSDANTHISTRVMGTFGYLAPEYASSGKLTDKSDVYSFGVVILELITGRRPIDSTQTFTEDSLVDWARPLLSRALEDKNFDPLVDPRLQNRYNDGEMVRMVACAASCVRHSARRRPRMCQIVRALEGDVSLSDLSEGIRPGQSSVYGSYGSSDYDSNQYKEDMKVFRKKAFPSQEHGSSEYGVTTSEDG